MSFLSTDGGPHPPDKIAAQVARQIGDLIVIDEHSASLNASTGRKQKPRLILDIAEAIEGHYDEVMQYEREKLLKSTEHLSTSLDHRKHDRVHDQLEIAVEAIVACSKGTVFEDPFQTEKIHDVIRGIIGSWFATAMYIERDWVANGHTISIAGKALRNPDHNADCPHVRAWRRRAA